MGTCPFTQDTCNPSCKFRGTYYAVEDSSGYYDCGFYAFFANSSAIQEAQKKQIDSIVEALGETNAMLETIIEHPSQCERQ